MEKIAFGSQKLIGYVCGPKKGRGIIVIQDWWGVTEITRNHANMLADKGYRCLIPDLYHGNSTVDKEEASHLMDNLDWPRAVEELGQAVDYLRTEEKLDRVGGIGFCMGGALSLAAGQHCGVDAAISFYGTPPKDLCQPEKVEIPVQLHVGELDNLKGFSDVATMEAWSAAKLNGIVETHVYENCGHAFLNKGDLAVRLRAHMGHPEPSLETQKLAWDRVLHFFATHLE